MTETLCFPVLVVIADPAYRQTVALVLGKLGLDHIDVPTWRDGVAWLQDKPRLAIYDLDQHPSADHDGLLAVVRRGWGEPVPLLILSGRPDVETFAVEELGAVEGLRKPLSVPRLFAAIERALELGTDAPTDQP